MLTNFFAFFRFLWLFLKLKLFNLKSRLPDLSGGVLDEQIALIRQAQMTIGEKPLDGYSPAQARSNFRKAIRLLRLVGGRFEKVASMRNLDIPGPSGAIPARVYFPSAGGPRPLMVYFHGGGFVIGDPGTSDNIARFICKHVGCVVLSVDYRLAPEHTFPSAVEDAFASTLWAAEHAGELGGDPEKLLLGGDSAGATLSAVVSQMARQGSSIHLAGQVLLYPATDTVNLDTPSYLEFGEKPLGLPKRDIEWFYDQYLPDPKDRSDPRSSPLLSKDFHWLPPALVVTAEFDVLRDEGEAYARRLEEAGGRVKRMRCNGMIHGFLSLIGLSRRATQYFFHITEEILAMLAL